MATSEYLRLLLAHAPVAICCVDREGTILLSEGAGLARLGRKPGEVVGSSVTELTDTPWFAADIARTLAGESFRNVAEIRGAWVAVDYLPLRNANGEVAGALCFSTDITPQKVLEAQLREAEQRYRRLSEVAFEALAIHDGGRIVDANASCARLFGYDSPEELIGKSALELTAPESRPVVLQHIASGLSDEPYEARGLRKDGSTFDGELRSRSITWQGRLLRVTAMRPTEERRRLEREAREAAERLRLVIESAPLILFALDAQGTMLLMEGRGTKLLGVPREALLGRNVYEVFGNEPSIVASTKRALAGEDFTMDIPMEQLGLVWETTATPLRDASGRVIGTTGVALDVTARKRAEAERERLLREVDAERRRYQALAGQLSAVLEHMVEAVIVVDAEGNFTQANQAARQLFNVESLEEMTRVRNTGTFEARRLDGSPIEAKDGVLARALRGEVVVQDEMSMAVKGIRRFLRMSGAPIRDADGHITGAVCVMGDLTAEVTFDHLKDQFLSVAAHELRTPVAVIKSATQAALQTEATGAALQRTLDRIDRGASRIDRIVGDLLDASQLQLGRLALHMAPLDLGALVTEAAQGLAASAPQHTLELRCDPVVVEGDRVRLTQVVTQLVRNAIKYSPRGGPVEVTVARDDREATVCVRDHGVGIAPERQANVFESFYTAHTGTPHDYGGLGVGLHVAREFVRRHRGRMWFDSQEGVGSTFCFALPLPVSDGESR